MFPLAARIGILALSALIVFGVVGAILLRVLPGPHRSTDFFVIGTVSTLAALGALFVAVITGWLKSRDIFYKRRQKPGA